MSGDAIEQRRFRTAADHYLAGRPPYADRLIARVAAVAGLRRQDRVLDLGCGPGQLARAFAPFAQEVLALDPEPEMLRVARDVSAEDAPITDAPITWQLAGSGDLSPAMGSFRLVTMGRSFHWMDREETLRRLDRMVEPGGAVALFHDVHPPGPDNDWYGPFRALLQRYAGEDSVGARACRPDWVRHETILLRSAFSHVEEIGVYERRPATVEGMIQRALSMSSTSAARLGERTGAMVDELRASLPDGPFFELVLSQALLGFRPEGARGAVGGRPEGAPGAARGSGV